MSASSLHKPLSFLLVVLFTTITLGANAQKVIVSSAESKTGSLSIGSASEAKKLRGDVVTVATKQSSDSVGVSYALIIGVKDYDHESINDLDFPIEDAKKLQTVLTQTYSFAVENVTLLENPNRKQITAQLEKYVTNITNKDKLLLFYAGHGYWDEKFKEGYWFASNARKDDRSSWLSNSTLSKYLQAIPAKHTLLITDACFSGSIFKVRDAFVTDKATLELERYTSRKAMTSGALKTVPDKSVFVEYLVKRLQENTAKHLSAEQLFSSFKIAVINNSPNNQIPQFGVIHQAGDEGGDFVFELK